ncbi:tyrosine-type recombinase/integrase [Lysobacter sp. P5_B9]
MALSDTGIRKAKPGEKPIKMTDGGGLYLLLNPNGSRWWRWDFRHLGKRKTLSMGVYPDTGLADARQKRDDARKLLAAGVDPGGHRKATKAAMVDRAANSFEVVAREWLGKRTWVPEYSAKVTAWFDNDVFPWIGARAVADLKAPDFLRVVRRVEDRGAIESAHRLLQNCGQVMRYAVATGRAERDPVSSLRGALPAPPEKHHAAITDPKAVGGLMRAIDSYAGSFITKSALRLAPLVFVRPGELRQAEWTEFDLDAAEWNIPAEKMKTRAPHLVPLSTQAVAVLTELNALTGQGRYVFPSARSSKRPMSNNAVLSALRRMGFEKGEMSGHGFRAMARTILDEVLHFRPDYIEHQLAHAVRDPNGRAYNRTAHLAERLKMMQAWADYLDAQKADIGKIVPIKRTASGTSR